MHESSSPEPAPRRPTDPHCCGLFLQSARNNPGVWLTNHVLGHRRLHIRLHFSILIRLSSVVWILSLGGTTVIIDRFANVLTSSVR